MAARSSCARGSLTPTSELCNTTVRREAAAPIKIGLLEDVSGNLAMFGIPKLHGSQLAVEEVNAGGGVLGRPLELIHLDPRSSRH